MERKKIVLIGPVYPFKGGISHYTGQMCRSFQKEYDVEMISFKMQYPKILFRKEQRDYSNDSFKIDATKYLLNTANPFNIFKTAKYIQRCKPDMVIIQWWHPYFAPCYRLLMAFMGKQNITFICHNVFPHERFVFDQFLTRQVLKKGNHYIVHAKEEAEELKKIKKNADYRVTPHPTYNMFQMKNMTKADARKRISIENKEHVILFFGFIREYKGLKHLLKAMPSIVKNVENSKLLVVGEFDSDKEEYTTLLKNLEKEECSELMNHIQLVDGYTPDQEVEKYFAASDLVVLPYESATQSGIVQIAFGFHKPVIVTNVGGLPDVVEHMKTGYIVEACNSKQIAEAVIDFYHHNRQEEMIQLIKKEEYRFSWDRMVEEIQSFREKQGD